MSDWGGDPIICRTRLFRNCNTAKGERRQFQGWHSHAVAWYLFSIERRVAWSRCCVTMCLERRLARHCDMVTQQRDHATL